MLFQTIKWIRIFSTYYKIKHQNMCAWDYTSEVVIACHLWGSMFNSQQHKINEIIRDVIKSRGKSSVSANMISNCIEIFVFRPIDKCSSHSTSRKLLLFSTQSSLQKLATAKMKVEQVTMSVHSSKVQEIFWNRVQNKSQMMKLPTSR